MIYDVLLPLVLLVTLSRFINPFLSIWFPWYYTVLEVKCWSLEININVILITYCVEASGVPVFTLQQEAGLLYTRNWTLVCF